LTAGASLHHRLDVGAVLVVVAERRERHRRLARVAVAQNQHARGRHSLGQDLAAQHRRGLGLQEHVQGVQDGFAGGGHDDFLNLLSVDLRSQQAGDTGLTVQLHHRRSLFQPSFVFRGLRP